MRERGWPARSRFKDCVSAIVTQKPGHGARRMKALSYRYQSRLQCKSAYSIEMAALDRHSESANISGNERKNASSDDGRDLARPADREKSGRT
jgi:hypothetical protein